MHIEITESPSPADEAFVAEQVRAHNRAYTENAFRTLCVFARADDGSLIGGLTGKTYWQYLDVYFLWVAAEHRNAGLASRILASAEAEAIQRGCSHALLNTFSFQAPDFYPKVGYREFGRLSGYGGMHEQLYDRHFMYKALVA